ncbi:hypothetical protein BX616_006254 [Lobosporangium transversale]|nr:hypothetical protein BX616_006254 [Lobosporangium transversale]
MIPAHMPSSKLFTAPSATEQILTAPELRSMGGNDLENNAVAGCFSTGVLLHTSNDYSNNYMQRDAQYHITAPHPHMQYTQNQYYRHSYQATTPHQQGLDASRYMYMTNELDQVINSAIEMSASARGIPPPFRTRRTLSMEVPSTASMSMSESYSYGSFYGNGEISAHSLPCSPSPSSLDASPVCQATEPESMPSLMVDGHPHPFFVPMHASAMASSPIIKTENVSVNSSPSLSASSTPSPSMAFSASFSSTFSSPSFSPASDCTSPSMPSNTMKAQKIKRKRFSTDSVASCSSVESQQEVSSPKAKTGSSGIIKKPKQRYVCHVPNCNRTFSRPYNLKSHGLTHDAHRPHACAKCSKTFARIHDRDRHMNSHMTEKPHECIVCLGRFGRQDAVIRHLKLSNETNACSWILKAHNISFRDAAAGRVTREALGEESKIRETLEALEEHARKARATRTLELMSAALPATFFPTPTTPPVFNMERS